MIRFLLAGVMLMASTWAGAATPASLLDAYAKAAATDPGFGGFSASRGDALFHRPARDWSCATCHTADARAQGQHVVTGKPIAPLSPVADPRRFTDPARAEKWFKRNCKDVLGRECTALEKGDVLTYLLSLRK